MAGKYKKVMLSEFPQLVMEWDWEKNGDLQPENISVGSSKKVFWKCDQGPDHEWSAAIKDRVGCANRKGTLCPCCAGRKLSVTNSLATRHPEIAAQWDYEANGGRTPEDFTEGSGYDAWWVCSQGEDHKWHAPIIKRWHSGGKGCPFCAGSKPSKKHNLAVLHPHLLEEWDYDKNEISPDQVLPGSKESFFWVCKKNNDHKWPAKPNNRVSGLSGCPFCSGNKVSPETSAAFFCEEIVNFWDYSKNEFTPHDVTYGSSKKVQFICSQGTDHAWTNEVRGFIKTPWCPFCKGRRASVTNNLEAMYPEVALQWDDEKNEVELSSILPVSKITRHWKCDKGPDHEWSTSPYARTITKQGCPYCAGKKASVTNSLEALYPEIAEEFFIEKNNDILPSDVVAKSGKTYIWKCLNKHEWPSTVHNRTLHGSGCPECTVVPRSLEEIKLAHELKHFYDFDLDVHKVICGKDKYDVDMIVQDLNLVIEYDGSYWHRNRDWWDSKKTAILTRAGYRVVRVRENPLTALHDDDIEFPFSDLHSAAVALILKVFSIAKVELPPIFKEYRDGRKLIKEKEAGEYKKRLTQS